MVVNKVCMYMSNYLQFYTILNLKRLLLSACYFECALIYGKIIQLVYMLTYLQMLYNRKMFIITTSNFLEKVKMNISY